MKLVHTTAQGHNLFSTKIDGPTESIKSKNTDLAYKSFYAISQQFGQPLMYAATGYCPGEVHIFFPNGQMWSSSGRSIAEAVAGAVVFGWMYANND